MTDLVQDGKSHVTNDVGTVDDQSVPLLKADDPITSQVCLLKCLHMCQTVTLIIVWSDQHGLHGQICNIACRTLIEAASWDWSIKRGIILHDTDNFAWA